MTKRQNVRGFVLLITLVLVMIAGIALTAVARQSTLAAIDALGAEEELQRRWAVTSCRDTLIDRASSILVRSMNGDQSASERETAKIQPSASAAPAARGQASRQLRCQLSGLEINLRLADEQTKLNFNILWARHGATKARRMLAEELHAGGVATASSMRIDPRPLRRQATIKTQMRSLPLFGSFDQLAPGAPVEAWSGSDGRDGLASRITLWGDGKVHFRSSPDHVIEQACSGLIEPTAMRAFLAGRRSNVLLALEPLLESIEQLTESNRNILRNVLTERSDCHSLWITIHSLQRTRTSLSVGEGTTTGPDVTGKVEPVRPVNRRRDFSW